VLLLMLAQRRRKSPWSLSYRLPANGDMNGALVFVEDKRHLLHTDYTLIYTLCTHLIEDTAEVSCNSSHTDVCL